MDPTAQLSPNACGANPVSALPLRRVWGPGRAGASRRPLRTGWAQGQAFPHPLSIQPLPLTPLHTPALSSLAYPSPLGLDHMTLADHTVSVSSLLQESSRVLSCKTSLLSQDLFLVWQHLLCTVLICPQNSPMSLQGKKPRLRNWFQDTVRFLFLSLFLSVPPSLLPSPPTLSPLSPTLHVTVPKSHAVSCQLHTKGFSWHVG